MPPHPLTNRRACPALVLVSMHRLSICMVLFTGIVWATPGSASEQTAQTSASSQPPPERIVTLFQGATDNAVALGLEPVGVVESWTEQPMYHYLRPYFHQVNYLGLETQPDLETIALLKPDLIIGERGRHQLISPLLSRIAPTVIAEQLYDFKALLKLIGEAVGREIKAEQLLACWQLRVTDFREKMASRSGDGWPQEVSVIRFRGPSARIYYSGFARSVLDELGFTRPASQQNSGWGINLTSRESIPAMDADAIFFFMVDSDPSVMETYHKWTQHPLWQQLEAAQAKQIFRVDAVTWNLGGGYIAANKLLDELYAHYTLDPRKPAASMKDCCQC